MSTMDDLQIGAGTPDFDNQFYRPTPRFIASRTASGSALLFSPEVREMEREVDYLEERFENMNAGEKALMGMLKLGNAFRFIEKLYSEGAIDFPTRRMTGATLCELYEELRQDAFIWDFSYGNSKNAGCK